MRNEIDIRRLYRLPYSKNDNPNGWLEITTRCNLRCPGCYRGCHLAGGAGEDKPLAVIREEVVRLQEIRNCHTISISGGEPLLHPELDAVIAFIRERGLQSLLYTNARLLDDQRLAGLKRAGLGGVITRIDILQEGRPARERDLHGERDRLLAMIRRAGGILPAFTMVLDRRNIDQVAEVVDWAQRREIGFLVLIARRDFIHRPDDRPDPGGYIDRGDLAVRLSALEGFRFAAYLGSQLEDARIKWVQAHRILHAGRVLGYLDARAVELLQTWHHLRTGRYCYVPPGGSASISLPALALLALLDRSVRRVLGRWACAVLARPQRLLGKPTVQVLNAVFPPTFVGGRRDFCDGCPDAILHEGRLVPSCVLEEIKAFGAPAVLREVARDERDGDDGIQSAGPDALHRPAARRVPQR
jgi:hypothetical protein